MKVGNLPFVAVSCRTIYESVVDVEDDVELVGCDTTAPLGRLLLSPARSGRPRA
jgi:hypothetical protein